MWTFSELPSTHLLRAHRRCSKRRSRRSLQMIDFGVSVDMSLFPPGTTFTNTFEKAENKTPDMLEGRPWTFQVRYLDSGPS